MIKILHCADLHLDSPITALDMRRAEVRRNELRAAFTSLILSAKMNAADFLLISGDLFDGAFVARDTIDLLKREFSSIPDTRVIIAPGNHDPFTHSSYYNRAEFSDNVFIFDSSELSFFDFPDKNTTVYGWAFTSERMDAAPIADFKVENTDRINLLVAHGDLDAASSKYCPINAYELAACEFDYVALGHRHVHDGVKRLGNGYVSYSGCLEGRGFDELGMKGAILAAADKDPTLKFAAKFVRFCKRHYEIDTLDLTGAMSNADVIDRIAKMIADKHYGDDTALRIRLIGNISGAFKLAPMYITERFSQLFLLELVDETIPLLDSEKLAKDPTLRGAFYRSLSGMLASEDETERETAARALRVGLAALAGDDVIDF